jgi:hypothetical protein
VAAVGALALAWPSPTRTNGAQVAGWAKEAPFEIRDAEALLRDMQGTAAEKLAPFEKVKVRGGFAGEDRVEIKVERMLRKFAATEKVTRCAEPDPGVIGVNHERPISNCALSVLSERRCTRSER